MRDILNESSKNENINKNKVLLNRQNTNTNKEILNMNNKIRYIKNNIKSISGKNIFLSPKKEEIYNRTYLLQNNFFSTKKQNNSLINNNNISFPSLRTSLKNTNKSKYKINNLNINYFNIIQPYRLFYSPQSSQTNSKNKIINKNKFFLSNNLNNSNNKLISDRKLSNTTMLQKSKIKMELNSYKQKNSLFLIKDYSYNINKKNKKISGTSLQQYNRSYLGSSFSPNKSSGTPMANITFDKKNKKLIKKKIYNNDMKSINYNKFLKKLNNNKIVRNKTNTTKMQNSFIKIPSIINNVKRNINNGRNLMFKNLK